MKKIFILPVLALLMVVSSCKPQQDKAADLNRLFEVMNAEKMIDEVMESMVQVMQQQAGMQFAGNENAKEMFDSYMDFVMVEVTDLTKKMMDEDMVQVYDKHFTQEEIQGLIKFYESSIGQKLLEKTPEISKDVMELMMQKHLPVFQQKLMKKLEELKENAVPQAE